MKRIFTITMLFLLTGAKAQNPSYRVLDSLASVISGFGHYINGSTYEQNGTTFQPYYTKTNFSYQSHNRTVSSAVYLTSENRERLYLTEGIDFSKATGMLYVRKKNNISRFTLYFPKGSLRTGVYENGKLTGTSIRDSLDFYVSSFIEMSVRRAFFDLHGELRILKRLATAKHVEKERHDDTDLSEEDFIAKYPNSIFTKGKLASLAQTELLRPVAKEIIAFAEELSKEVGWKPNASLNEYTRQLAGHQFNLFKEKDDGTRYYTRKIGGFLGAPLSTGGYYPDGPAEYIIDRYGKVAKYSYYYRKQRNDKGKNKAYFEGIKAKFSTTYYFTEESSIKFMIDIPKSAQDPKTIAYLIQVTYMDLGKVTLLILEFWDQDSSN